MNRKTKPRARFRVGDWVALLFGASVVLAQVIEDRGLVGKEGKRVYRIRLDLLASDPMEWETREDFLEPATEADRAAWAEKWSLGIHQPVSYAGKDKDPRGLPTPLHRYLILAKPGPDQGAAVALIVPLSASRYSYTGLWPYPQFVAEEGGPDAAIAKAEEYLDALPLHSGLRKSRGKRGM